MDTSTNSCLAVGFSKEFLDRLPLCADTEPRKAEYELLLIGESGEFHGKLERAETVVCPRRVTLDRPLPCSMAVTCGMTEDCTVSFSSISENSALLSLSRPFSGRRPCDVRVKLRQGVSVYENLVLQAVRILEARDD
ncbi:MAG: hypothetical protein ACI3W9_07795 [Eubacteriales bacterium]